MYAAMYKKICSAVPQQKQNIYTNSAFAPLPVKEAPRAQPIQLYYPTGDCGQPYQTPLYHPPYCDCTTCITK
jgi:hypothetical protein